MEHIFSLLGFHLEIILNILHTDRLFLHSIVTNLFDQPVKDWFSYIRVETLFSLFFFFPLSPSPSFLFFLVSLVVFYALLFANKKLRCSCRKDSLSTILDMRVKEFLMNVHTMAHTAWNPEIPCCFRPEISQQGILRRQTFGNRNCTWKLCRRKGTGIVETHACPMAWIFRKFDYGLRVVCRYVGKMQNFVIVTGNFGVKGALCRYNRKEYPKDSRVYSKPVKKRCGAKSVDKGFYPVYEWQLILALSDRHRFFRHLPATWGVYPRRTLRFTITQVGAAGLPGIPGIWRTPRLRGAFSGLF
mgnify:CR=1 FL=1